AEFPIVEDPMLIPTEENIIVTDEYRPVELSILPFLDFDGRKHDCMLPLMNTMTKLPYHQHVYVQWVSQRIADDWKHQLKVKLESAAWIASFPFRPVFWVRPKIMERFQKAVDKGKSRCYNVNLRAAVVAPPPRDPEDPEELAQIEESVTNSLQCIYHGLRYTLYTHMGRYYISRRRVGYKAFGDFRERTLKKPFWLGQKELCAQWHPVALQHQLNLTETLAQAASPPAQLGHHSNPATTSLFGRTDFRNSNMYFGIPRTDRKSHIHIIGKSGSGKSKLIQLLAKSDIDQGYGLALLDCHGDLVDELLHLIPEHRAHDVALLDISDTDFPICFNPFASVKDEHQRYMATEFLDTLKRVEGIKLPESIEQLVIHCLLAVMQAPNTSVISILQMLTEPSFRKQLIQTIPHGSIADYWKRENPEHEAQFSSGEIQSIVRVLSHLLSSNLVSYIFGQRENRFDFSDMMAKNQIILVKIPKKNLGKECSILFGSLILSLLNVAANARAGIPASQRKDFYIYVDEFQNFASTAATKAITEGDKNGVSYTIAHQMVKQLSGEVYETLKAKVQNIIAFQLGGDDAAALEGRLSPPFEASDMPNLDARRFYIRMSLESELRPAFSGRTVDVVYPSPSFAQEVRDASRKQFARSNTEIAGTILATFRHDSNGKQQGLSTT
ncbi:MAG: type IV secretion system DNA-binding domain-containing protein, partial [Bdellovibrionales bacterium]|nr:type IV secretion system DNA-binding domain-containing protein [Bdellovibrionales bacterium]